MCVRVLLRNIYTSSATKSMGCYDESMSATRKRASAVTKAFVLTGGGGWGGE